MELSEFTNAPRYLYSPYIPLCRGRCLLYPLCLFVPLFGGLAIPIIKVSDGFSMCRSVHSQVLINGFVWDTIFKQQCLWLLFRRCLVRIPAGTTTVFMSGTIPWSLGTSRDRDSRPRPLQSTIKNYALNVLPLGHRGFCDSTVERYKLFKLQPVLEN
jgi:hypothetical protein